MHREQYKGFSPDSGSVEPLNFESELSPHQSDNSNEEQLDHLLAGYDYQLPPERIAQNPAVPRDSARLLVINSPTDHTHQIFRDLSSLLLPGDLLVMNNTRVIPARLYGRKSSGAAVEVLLVEERQPNIWLALVKPGRRLQPGVRIFFEQETRGQGDKGTRGQGDKGTRGQGDKGTRRQGDKGTRGQGDKETRGQGDKGTRGQGDKGKDFLPLRF